MNPQEIIRIIESIKTDKIIDFSDAKKIIDSNKKIPKQMRRHMSELLYKKSMGWRV